MNVCRESILMAIGETQESIEGCEYSSEESHEACQKVRDWLSANENNYAKFPLELKVAMVVAERANLEMQLARYLETMRCDLMKVDSLYLITDTPHLQSPAGFMLDSHVYVQTTIAIHSDDPNFIPPSCNVKLYRHKIPQFH